MMPGYLVTQFSVGHKQLGYLFQMVWPTIMQYCMSSNTFAHHMWKDKDSNKGGEIDRIDAK